MNTYKWFVYQFQVNPSLDILQNVVVKVYWKRQAISEPNGIMYVYEMKGETDLSAPNPSDFTDFDNLTLEIVVPWLEASLNMTAINNQLDIELDKLINPIYPFKPIPWKISLI